MAVGGEGYHGRQQNELTSRRVRGLISSIGLVACGYISVSAAAAASLLLPQTTTHQPAPLLLYPFFLRLLRVCKSLAGFGAVKLAVDLAKKV